MENPKGCFFCMAVRKLQLKRNEHDLMSKDHAGLCSLGKALSGQKFEKESKTAR